MTAKHFFLIAVALIAGQAAAFTGNANGIDANLILNFPQQFRGLSPDASREDLNAIITFLPTGRWQSTDGETDANIGIYFFAAVPVTQEVIAQPGAGGGSSYDAGGNKIDLGKPTIEFLKDTVPFEANIAKMVVLFLGAMVLLIVIKG